MAPSYTSIAASLMARGIEDTLTTDIGDLKSTFSSWDSCMSKAYCKWPVIAAIIVGGLIVLLVLTSIARCLCCGLECCFGCCMCFNACCPSPRGRRSRSEPKYAPAPYQPPPQYPYFPQPGMNYGAQPQFATFDASSSRSKGATNIHEDSLPAMPSWQTSQSRRVMHDDEDDDTAYHGAPGEQENGDIALGGMSGALGGLRGLHNQNEQEQRQPMLSSAAPLGSQEYNTHPAYRDQQNPAASAYPYQTAGAHAGGDLSGYNNNNTTTQSTAQMPSRYDSMHSAAPPSYRTAPSPSPYAQGYSNAYAPQQQQQRHGYSNNNNNSYDEPSSTTTAYGGAAGGQRTVRFDEEPAPDLFYPTPAARVDAPAPQRRPVGGDGGPSWM